MNKKLIAIAVSAAALSNGLQAVELYNEAGTTFSIGGHVAISLQSDIGDVATDADTVEYEGGDTALGSNSPRINFVGSQDFGNGWTAEAKGEWGMAFMDGGENTFTTRVGRIKLINDDYGTTNVGTQWSPYFEVSGVADMPIAFANDFSYDNQYNLGVARAEGMLSYSNKLEINDVVSIDGGVGWQGDNGDYKDRVQVSLSLNIADYTVGYAHSTGDREDIGSSTETAVSNVISAHYGEYGVQGIYAAAVYASNEYMNSSYNYNTGADRDHVLEESSATEFIIAYSFANSLNVSLNYETVEDTLRDETIFSQSALQAEYNFSEKFVGFVAYQVDLGSDVADYEDNENDQFNIGIRYYL